MGMYTCMRFVGVLKKEYIDDIKKLKEDDADYNKNCWEIFAEKYPFAKNFSKLERATFIPFGDFSSYNEDKYIEQMNLIDWQTWIFQCDLKNYGDEIATFLKEIATVICTKFTAEVWYEEQDMCDVCWFKDGELHFVDLGDIEL